MIKLNNKYYSSFYINKSIISLIDTTKDEHGWPITIVKLLDGSDRLVKETPEEILAMPDIEASEKVIDWEQRRYEIANNIIGRILSVPYFLSAAKDNPIESLVSVSVRIADALINELKKGCEK